MRLIASIVTALVLVAVGGAQARSMAAISIAVTTNNKPVGGLQLATYGIPARITGTVGTGQAGVAVVLQASKFPFKAAFAAVGLILAPVYMLRLFQGVTQGAPAGPVPKADIRAGQLSVLAPLVVLMFVIGLYPAPLTDLMTSLGQTGLAR